MKPSGRLVVILVAAAMAGWLLFVTSRSLYFLPRSEIVADIDRYEGFISEVEKARLVWPEMSGQLQSFVDRTLGGDEQTVDARLRSRLNRIGEDIGLDDLVVSSGQVKARLSPAQRSLSSANPYRREADFVELEGRIAGEGTLEQVTRLVHRVDAEPWLKRIDSVSLDPKANGARFTVSIRLTTLFLPGLHPSDDVQQPPYNPADFDRYAAFVATNVFHLPPPTEHPVATATTTDPTPDENPAPRSFPYGDWRVTGVVQGGGGVEVWLRSSSGEERTLQIGGRLHEAELISASGEHAEFRIGEQRFLVGVGDTLADRSPLVH